MDDRTQMLEPPIVGTQVVDEVKVLVETPKHSVFTYTSKCT